jgi:hypothetical protein
MEFILLIYLYKYDKKENYSHIHNSFNMYSSQGNSN